MLTWSLRSFSCVHCLFDVSAKQLRGRSLNSEVLARETRRKQSQAYLFPTSVTIQVCSCSCLYIHQFVANDVCLPRLR